MHLVWSHLLRSIQFLASTVLSALSLLYSLFFIHIKRYSKPLNLWAGIYLKLELEPAYSTVHIGAHYCTTYQDN